jgi:23S rRNA pseudouridine1911/1915/1917 synthase
MTRADDDAKRSFEEERRVPPADDDAKRSFEEERRVPPADDDAERSDVGAPPAALGVPPSRERRGGPRGGEERR